MTDLLIKNATIVDGSGSASFVGDIAIQEGKISNVGHIEENAKKVMDASGLYASPGFIDAHSHGDQALGTDCSGLSKLSQGVTTEIVGPCGTSAFPVSLSTTPDYPKLAASFGVVNLPKMECLKDFSSYKNHVKTLNLRMNAYTLVGHGNLRMASMGFKNRKPTESEMQNMKRMLREAMENGCLGLSSGLIYPPGCFASREELAELCKVVKEYNGFYSTHIRDESEKIIEAIEEALYVARESGVRLWISHIKIMGIKNHGLSSKVLSIIRNAVEEGIDVTLDQYPYRQTGTLLNVCIPPWYFDKNNAEFIERLKQKETRKIIEQEMSDASQKYSNNYLNSGGFKGIVPIFCPNCKDAEGISLAEYAEKKGQKEFDAYFDLLIATGGGGLALYNCISDDDICNFIQYENVVIGSDGVCGSFEGKFHPRTFGTFTKAINLFVKEKKIIRLETMIHKMTGLTAERLKITNKGLIKRDYDADIVLFDLNKVKDKPGTDVNSSLSDGIEKVYINGRLAYENGSLTSNVCGEFLLANRKE